MFRVSILIVTILIFGCDNKQSDSTKVSLKSVDVNDQFDAIKYRPLNPKFHIFPIKEKDEVRGIPDTLSEVTILHQFFDSNQYFYQSVRNGHISQELYNELSEDIDSTQLTSEWVDLVLTLFVGKDSNSVPYIVVDTNNDEDMSNEKLIYFSRVDLKRNDNTVSMWRATVNVSFDHYQKGTVTQFNVPVRFEFRADNSLQDLYWYVPEYRRGLWTIRGDTFDVALEARPTYRKGLYDYVYIDVNRDGKFDTRHDGVEAYSISEPFNIGGIGWKIIDLAADGSSFTAMELKETILPKASLKVGNPAPDFSGITLDGKSVNLGDYRGKFVLLDFWASWCPYCINEVSYQKEAISNLVDQPFIILGIAGDSDVEDIISFIKQKNITWPQIHQTNKDEIPSLYNVFAFPTQYLIDPEGIIIANGNELRGKNLLDTLERYIYQ